MDLLIIGGTRFVGRHIAEAALARGHGVTLFHRGKTGNGVLPAAQTVHGDRTNRADLLAVADKHWDAIIDTCGYLPRDTILSAEILSDHTDRYLYVSSIAVYDNFGRAGIDESAATISDGDPNAAAMDSSNYGALKVLCEDAVLGQFGERATIVRPGLIVGPHDPTGRFTYWPARIARGGEVLAPGSPRGAVQFIDARDLASFAVLLIESSTTGIFNAVGLQDPLDMRSLLEACRSVVGGDATFTWVSDAFLAQHGVEPFGILPFWTPDQADLEGVHKIDTKRAAAAGLRLRALADTIRDTFEWNLGKDPSEEVQSPAIDSSTEARILADWHKLSKPY